MESPKEKDARKPDAQPEPIEPLAPRADVRAAASPVRCPFCHEDVAPQAADWVACSACLARHHGSCWSESGACASCGKKERLARPPSVWRFLAALALVTAAFLIALAAPSNLVASVTRPAPKRVAPPRISLAPKLVVLADAGLFEGSRHDALLVRLRDAVACRLTQHFRGGEGREWKAELDARGGRVVVSLDELESWATLEKVRAVLEPRGDFRVRTEDATILDADAFADVEPRVLDEPGSASLELALTPAASERLAAQLPGTRQRANGFSSVRVVVDGVVYRADANPATEQLVIDGTRNGLAKGDIVRLAAILAPGAHYPGPTTLERAPATPREAK